VEDDCQREPRLRVYEASVNDLLSIPVSQVVEAVYRFDDLARKLLAEKEAEQDWEAVAALRFEYGDYAAVIDALGSRGHIEPGDGALFFTAALMKCRFIELRRSCRTVMLKLDPENPELLAYLALLSQELRESRVALELAERALKVGPRIAFVRETYHYLATPNGAQPPLRCTGSFLRDLPFATVRSPIYGDWSFSLQDAIRRAALGIDPQEALPILDTVLTVAPAHEDAHIVKLKHLMHDDRFDTALREMHSRVPRSARYIWILHEKYPRLSRLRLKFQWLVTCVKYNLPVAKTCSRLLKATRVSLGKSG
jgi:tetratricopeptide (TPR) repeat protein